MSENKLKQIINQDLRELEVDELLKQKMIDRCQNHKKEKMGKGLKVASILLAGIVMIGAISGEQVLAAIRNLLTYSSMKNEVVPLDQGSYHLESPVTLTTDKGYMKVEGCEVKNGEVEFRIVSNMECFYEDWEKEFRIRDKQGNEHLLSFHNTTGVSSSLSKETTWTIEAEGFIEGLGTVFEIITPFGDMPIQCTLAKALSGIEEIGVSAYDRGIYITARREQEGEKTVIILTAFNEDYEQIQAHFETVAYNTEGKEVEMAFGMDGKDYYAVPIDEISRIEVRAVNQLVTTEEEKIELEVPKQGKIEYQQKVKVDQYLVEVIEGEQVDEELQLKVKVNGLEADEVCFSIACNFEFETYDGHGGNIEDDYNILKIYTNGELPECIQMGMMGIRINKPGNWSINF